MFPNTLSKTQSNLRMEIRVGNAVFKHCVRVPLMWKRYSKPNLDNNFTEIRDSYDRVPSSSVQSATPTWSYQPVLGLINRTRLHQVRGTLYCPRPGPRKSANIPGERLQKVLCKRLKPQNADEDSYVVATHVGYRAVAVLEFLVKIVASKLAPVITLASAGSPRRSGENHHPR
ncbi:hypothetical protein F5883DRAFT_623806 [Diaporthe sp. PMI_573]|nr:hypothetical protein F5883DRAFT_623806 [Diaporthaceae sp. PMI_573]